MTPLKPRALLQRIPHLTVHLDGNELRIKVADGFITCSTHGLTVLEAFAQPTPLGEGLDKLKAHGAQHWIELTSIVVQLHEAGILRDFSEADTVPGLTATGFGAAPIHVAMLNDRARTSQFLAGIREVIRPGDVVVEVGTGTGVLAVAAARAGAARVYTIEASAVAEVAASVFAENAVADRITLIRGWSTETDIPERADVFISEMIGNDPVGEHVLEITRDARQRLLKPQARYIPGRLRVYGLPVTIPDEELSKHAATAENLQRWRTLYEIDFTPLAAAVKHSHFPLFTIRPQEAAQWTALGEPVLLSDIDFAVQQSPTINRRLEMTAATSGLCNGMLVYFDIVLGPTAMLSTHPAAAGATNHWRCPVWYFGDSLVVSPGDRVGLHYQYGRSGTSSELRLVTGD